MHAFATSPVNLIWVVMLMPTTVMFAPEVHTISAASGSPYIWTQTHSTSGKGNNWN